MHTPRTHHHHHTPTPTPLLCQGAFFTGVVSGSLMVEILQMQKVRAIHMCTTSVLFFKLQQYFVLEAASICWMKRYILHLSAQRLLILSCTSKSRFRHKNMQKLYYQRCFSVLVVFHILVSHQTILKVTGQQAARAIE